jgi:hypothetical protein
VCTGRGGQVWADHHIPRERSRGSLGKGVLQDAIKLL